MAAPPRDERGRLLPGSCLNPSGRPARLREAVELAREWTPVAVATLGAICSDPTEPAVARVRAAELLLNRAWGQPLQAHLLLAEEQREHGLPRDTVVLDVLHRIAQSRAAAETSAVELADVTPPPPPTARLELASVAPSSPAATEAPRRIPRTDPRRGGLF